MKDIEREFQGWHGLFGVVYKKDEDDLVTLVRNDQELRPFFKKIMILEFGNPSFVSLDDWSGDYRGMISIRLDFGRESQAAFTDYRGDKSFLGDADLDMTGDELLYIKDKYSLFMYTITGKSREGNQRIRDRLLDMLTDPKVVKVYQRFEDFQAGLLEEVCMQRFNDELIVAEEIEVTSNKYCIMWDYLTRRREPVLQEVIGKNEELMNALTILESEEDMLYAGFTFNHNGESVSVTLSEPTTTYREGRLITPEGKSLDGTEYNSFSLTIWSKDRKLNAKYRDKIKAYFSRYDLRKVRAPRHFIDESFSYLENSLMQMNEQEK